MKPGLEPDYILAFEPIWLKSYLSLYFTEMSRYIWGDSITGNVQVTLYHDYIIIL